ncbi:MAG TPA: hypothetical protein VJ933_06625 [Phaeodactylibacter sp.]|nr:hypothetical protein [Phaeodactylibacter sp.]
MDKHNDKKARAKLKSYVPTYDQAGLWEEINNQLPEEQKDRKGFWLWIVGGSIVVIAIAWLAVYPSYKNSGAQNRPTVQQAAAHGLNSINRNLTTAETGEEECMDTGQKDDISLASTATPPTTVGAAHSHSTKKRTRALNTAGKRQEMGKVAKRGTPTPHKSGRYSVAETAANTTAPLERRVATATLQTLPLPDVKLATSNNRVAPIPDAAPHTTPSTSAKVALVAAFSAGQSSREFSALNGQYAGYVDERNATEQAKYQLQANLSAALPIYKGFYAKVGLHYEQQVETYTDNRIVSSVTEEVMSDSAGYLRLQDGSTAYFSGTTEQTTEVHRNILSYNRYHSLGLAASLGYRLHAGRLAFFGEAGLIGAPLRWQDGNALSPSLQIEPLRQASHRANTLSRYQLAGGVEYAFTPHYSLFGKLAYLADLSNRSTLDNTELAYRNLNIGLGIRLGF